MSLRRAVEKLGFRQKSYQRAFGVVGSPEYLAVLDLADYCAAWSGDTSGIDHDTLMQMVGRRQAFFRILNHLKLKQSEMEVVYKGAIMRAAERINSQFQGDE